MFFSHYILVKSSPFSKIWSAAFSQKKLTRKEIFSVSLEESVQSILEPQKPLSLRLSGHLLLGVVKIYVYKCQHLKQDTDKALSKINMAFHPGQVDLPPEKQSGTANQLNLPEARRFTIDDDHFADESFESITDDRYSYEQGLDTEQFFKSHIASSDDITMGTARFIAMRSGSEASDVEGRRRRSGLISDPELARAASDAYADDFHAPMDRSFLSRGSRASLGRGGARRDSLISQPEVGRDGAADDDFYDDLGMDGGDYDDFGSGQRASLGPNGSRMRGIDMRGLENVSPIASARRGAIDSTTGRTGVRWALLGRQDGKQQEHEEEADGSSPPAKKRRRRGLRSFMDRRETGETRISSSDFRKQLQDCSDLVKHRGPSQLVLQTSLSMRAAAALEDASEADMARRKRAFELFVTVMADTVTSAPKRRRRDNAALIQEALVGAHNRPGGPKTRRAFALMSVGERIPLPRLGGGMVTDAGSPEALRSRGQQDNGYDAAAGDLSLGDADRRDSMAAGDADFGDDFSMGGMDDGGGDDYHDHMDGDEFGGADFDGDAGQVDGIDMSGVRGADGSDGEGAEAQEARKYQPRMERLVVDLEQRGAPPSSSATRSPRRERFNSHVRGCTRVEAARCFMDLLELSSRGRVVLTQKAPYSDIGIAAGPTIAAH